MTGELSRYEAARRAYEDEAERIRKLSGCTTKPEPYDITGALVIEDFAWELLRDPTKKTAAKIYEVLLEYAEEAGWRVDGGYFHSKDQDHDN